MMSKTKVPAHYRKGRVVAAHTRIQKRRLNIEKRRAQQKAKAKQEIHDYKNEKLKERFHPWYWQQSK